MALMPRADVGTGYRSYWFYFFGFIFLLALGRKIPAQQRRTCSYHSPQTVSYTHLDVYKRQIWKMPANSRPKLSSTGWKPTPCSNWPKFIVMPEILPQRMRVPLRGSLRGQTHVS